MPTNTEFFKQHCHTPRFIETGTFMGDGVTAALEAGFKQVDTIELAKHYYERAVQKFQGDPRVKVHYGDSAEVLQAVMNKVNEQVTLWLDGHWSAADTAHGKTQSPLIAELETLAQHPVKNHVILIDDMRCWVKTDPEIGFGKEDLENKIRSINPAYRISYADGRHPTGWPIFPHDILIAKVMDNV